MPNGCTDPSTAFMTCTTCHNQHVMYIYTAPRGKQTGAKVAGGSYPTYFFVNAPYNPGAGNNARRWLPPPHSSAANATLASRTRANGVMNVATQF